MTRLLQTLCAQLQRRCAISVLFVLASLLATAPNAMGQGCPSKTGDCLKPHGGPGCTDLICCSTICQLDPLCCEEWDGACATQADKLCSALCGATAAGNCYAPNPTPSCSDQVCCELVCTIDFFCCQTAWDANCALLASFSCGGGKGGKCGDPESGDCNDPNGVPACNDEACCTSVCEIEPSCCESAWDMICVALADSLCGESCILNPPFNTPIELEDCGEELNDPCNGGEPQPLACGDSVTGKFRSATDVDVYQLDLVDDDSDGGIRVKISLISNISTRLDILTDPCDFASPLLTVQSDTCLESVSIACVPSGALYARISSDKAADPCGDDKHYLLSLGCIDYCEEPCENQEDCLLPHGSPGCADPSCCALVCESFPACCEWEWDFLCAQQAAQLCGGPSPENDLCENATPAYTGSTPFRQSLSTVDSIDPNACIDESTTTSGDVWFSHVVECDSQLLIGTCSTIDFDSIVEVFRGTCQDMQLLDCTDDTPACSFGTSLVQIVEPICGETLLIRVSGKGDSIGTGDLTIVCLGSICPCSGDFNNDNVVNGQDMGLFLVEWGKTNSPADLDGNGVVDGNDLGLFLVSWGPC